MKYEILDKRVRFCYGRLSKYDHKERMTEQEIIRKSRPTSTIYSADMSSYGGLTTATVCLSRHVALTVMVVCHERDRFNKKTGREMAFSRLNYALTGLKQKLSKEEEVK